MEPNGESGEGANGRESFYFLFVVYDALAKLVVKYDSYQLLFMFMFMFYHQINVVHRCCMFS